MSSDLRSHIDTLSLTHPSITAHRDKSVQSNTNLSNVIQPILKVPSHAIQLHPHNTYMPISFCPCLLTKYIPTYIIFYTHIPFFAPHFRHSKFLHFPFLTFNPTFANSFFLIHAIIYTHTIISFNTIGLTQNSTTTLTHVSQYRLFIMNGLYSTTKTSNFQIKKTTSTQHFHFWLNIFSLLFLNVYWQVDIPRCKEGLGVNDFTQYVPLPSFHPDLIHFIPTFQLNVTSSSQNSLSCLNILGSFPHKNLWRVFKLQVVVLSWSLYTAFSQSQLTVVKKVSRWVPILYPPPPPLLTSTPYCGTAEAIV